MDIRAELRSAGIPVSDIEPMGGGCVSAVYQIRTVGGNVLVAKADEYGDANLPIEAFMLQYLNEHTRLPVPTVEFFSEKLLVMSYISGSSRFDPQAERHAAELLAELHNITSQTYGFLGDTLIGGLRQPNKPDGSWLSFFRDQRLMYMAQEATRSGRLPSSLFLRIESLCSHLENWLFEPESPSLVHGDVWTTNVLAAKGRIVGFLDPAIYFAHDEIELAFTTLFHTFGRDFYERYQSIRPPRPGFYEERRDLYNLYPLLVHVRLFGGAYISSLDHVLQRYER